MSLFILHNLFFQFYSFNFITRSYYILYKLFLVTYILSSVSIQIPKFSSHPTQRMSWNWPSKTPPRIPDHVCSMIRPPPSSGVSVRIPDHVCSMVRPPPPSSVQMGVFLALIHEIVLGTNSGQSESAGL